MKKIFYKAFTVSILLSTLVLMSCAEDPTQSLYDLGTDPLATPMLSSINPPTEALAGVTKITVSGSNFSTEARNNLIYFNGKPGTVLSATTTQLEVISPVVISDTVLIKMNVIGSRFSNILEYKLKPAVAEFYPFDPKKNEVPYAITADKLENIYVSVSGLGTKKIDNKGVLSNFAPKGAETFFNSLTFGPSNTIFATRRVRGIVSMVEGTAPSTFVSSTQGIADNVIDTDFDQSLNMWAGGNINSLYRVTLAKNVKKFNISGSVNALKVVNNFVFVAARVDTQEVVWKIPIVTADSMGTPELYFNLSEKVDPVLKINDITLSADGDLYIGTNKSADPIFIVHPDKSFEVLYPGIIKSAVYSLVWGNGNFLYMTNIVKDVNTTVLKINMQKTGAPYYGRQ